MTVKLQKRINNCFSITTPYFTAVFQPCNRKKLMCSDWLKIRRMKKSYYNKVCLNLPVLMITKVTFCICYLYITYITVFRSLLCKIIVLNFICSNRFHQNKSYFNLFANCPKQAGEKKLFDLNKAEISSYILLFC